MQKQTIGEFLQTLRKANGYTQQQVADLLGVSNKTVSAWETDKACPDLMTIPAIADLYHVTADEILRGEKNLTDNIPELSPRTERIALKNRLIKFNTQNNILLIVAIAAIIFISVGVSLLACIIGIPILLTGIIAAIAVMCLRIVFYKNAELDACINCEEQLTEAQTDYLVTIRSTVRRCRNIESAVLTAIAAIIALAIFMMAATDYSGLSFAAPFLIILAVCYVVFAAALLIYCRKSLENDVKNYGNEIQKEQLTQSDRLLKKCLICGSIPAVIFMALYILSFNSITLSSAENVFSGTAEEVKTHLCTITLYDDSDLVTDYGFAAGEYVINLPSSPKDGTEYDAGNGLTAVYGDDIYDNGGFEIYYSDGNCHIAVSHARAIICSDGQVFYNVRYAEKQSVIKYYGSQYENIPSDTDYRMADVKIKNGTYTVKITEKTSLYLTGLAIPSAALFAVSVAVPCAIYLSKRKKVTFKHL